MLFIRKITEEELKSERNALTSADVIETLTPQSVYTQLEDGVLIEELPHQQIMMPAPPKSSRKVCGRFEKSFFFLKFTKIAYSDQGLMKVIFFSL